MELYVYLYVCYVYVEGIYGSNNCSMDMFMRLCDICYVLHIEGRQNASACI